MVKYTDFPDLREYINANIKYLSALADEKGRN